MPAVSWHVEMEPVFLEDARLPGLDVRYGNHDSTIRLHKTPCLGKRTPRVVEMLQYVPERDEIERRFGKADVLDSAHMDAFAQALFGGGSDGRGQLRSGNVPALPGKSRQEGTVAASNIEGTPGLSCAKSAQSSPAKGS